MQALVSLFLVGFLLYCVLNVALTDAQRVRNLPKLAWLVLVVLLPLIGGIAWLVAGRPERAGATPGGNGPRGRPVERRPSPGGRSGSGARRHPSRRPPRGPDDDPEFLRALDERLRKPPDDRPDGR